ncbi:DUF5665 domain-containing protein [Sinisalibacter aestuarii]|uniref:Uncharacterized protein n=1 Tax=Sinisalibacter aestuarii TaxID=2949426 RepID=A0ABQ5LP70_9RHOB|nr:DUF5665 domain-containing protein [Sinisalibacter aestuarii]GKY86768.1 hypothetical protein STA1M1_06370 [Sinisalibacter aestuarii]
MPDESTPNETLAAELQALRAEVVRLNEQRYFRVESSLWQVAFWSLVRGLAFGLGSVLGGTILLAFLIRMLGSIDFIPVLGDWAQQLIEEIQTSAPPD